jgi:hypothetical protein
VVVLAHLAMKRKGIGEFANLLLLMRSTKMNLGIGEICNGILAGKNRSFWSITIAIFGSSSRFGNLGNVWELAFPKGTI